MRHLQVLFFHWLLEWGIVVLLLLQLCFKMCCTNEPPRTNWTTAAAKCFKNLQTFETGTTFLLLTLHDVRTQQHEDNPDKYRVNDYIRAPWIIPPYPLYMVAVLVMSSFWQWIHPVPETSAPFALRVDRLCFSYHTSLSLTVSSPLYSVWHLFLLLCWSVFTSTAGLFSLSCSISSFLFPHLSCHCC